MKRLLFLILIVFLFSCSKNKTDKLIGTWFNSSIEESKFSKDTVNRFIEYTDNKEIYNLTSFYDGWLFFKGSSMDSIKNEQINFISKDKFEMLFTDSYKELIGIKENPIYNRVGKNIKPNKMMFDLYNNFYLFGTVLDVDTLGDGTINYDYSLTGTNDKSILELEHQVKYFIDKQMKTLPKEEELGKYSQWEKALMNIYTWEDLNTKILMECYFEFKDTTDKYRMHDQDQLKVKIWQNVK